MLPDTLNKIEERLRQAESLTPQQRAELLTLVGALKSEVSELARTHSDQAQAIAGRTDLFTHEATRGDRDAAQVETSLKQLSQSVVGFEESHPKLVQAVNSICTTLSNLGI